MFSPSPSTSSGEAHDADDDEGLTIFHRSWTHGNHWTNQIEIHGIATSVCLAHFFFKWCFSIG